MHTQCEKQFANSFSFPLQIDVPLNFLLVISTAAGHATDRCARIFQLSRACTRTNTSPAPSIISHMARCVGPSASYASRECGKTWDSVTDTDHSLGGITLRLPWRRRDGIPGMSTATCPRRNQPRMPQIAQLMPRVCFCCFHEGLDRLGFEISFPCFPTFWLLL